MQYYPTQTLSGTFDFTIECSGSLYTFTESAYSVGATSFDLLADSYIQFPLPTVTYTPSGCQSLIWKVYRASDGADMEEALPAVFSIGATHLTISHSVDSYSERKQLFGNNDYYFQGQVDDVGSRQTS